MAATSVTGVGLGIGKSKGPKNGRTVSVPMLSPHVITAGHATTSGGGTVTVTFPTALSGSNVNYAVMATPGAGSTAPRVTKTDDSNGNFASFTITGANSTAHSYVVISVGVPFIE